MIFANNYQLNGDPSDNFSCDYIFVDVPEFGNEPDDHLRIFPNPVEDNLNIRIYHLIQEEATIQISNVLGQIFHEEKLDRLEKYLDIDVSHLQTGTYFVHFYSDDGHQSQKFIKH